MPRLRRRGAAGVARCSAVRVTKTFGPVSSSWRLATIRSKRRMSMRGFCTCTTRSDVPRNAARTAPAMPPQPMARPGRGAFTASATAASGLGQNLAEIHFQGARGLQDAHIGGQPGGFGEAEGLGAQPGESFADDPRGGDVRHGGAFRRGGVKGQWRGDRAIVLPDLSWAAFSPRHGPACPGHLFQHPAAIGGPDKPRHDDWGFARLRWRMPGSRSIKPPAACLRASSGRGLDMEITARCRLQLASSTAL